MAQVLSRGSNYTMDYKSLTKCQSSVRPAGLQAHNVAAKMILYTDIFKELGSRGLRGHMWGWGCGGPLAPRRTLATHTVSTASRPAGDCCIGVKEATVLHELRGSRGSSCPLSTLGNPHRLDSVTTRRRLLHWCQGCQGLEGTEALIVLSPGLLSLARVYTALAIITRPA